MSEQKQSKWQIIKQAADEVAGVAMLLVGYGLLAMLAIMVAQQFGFRTSFVPALNPQVQIFLFGCWAAFRYTR